MATFLTRFGPWSPFFWLYIIDDKSITFPISDQSDWVRTFFNPGETHDARFSNLPSSCNFYQFLSTGTCEFYFDGLKTLFLADITLKFSTKTCGISSQFSSYAIDCIGKDCHIFSGLTACDTVLFHFFFLLSFFFFFFSFILMLKNKIEFSMWYTPLSKCS